MRCEGQSGCVHIDLKARISSQLQLEDSRVVCVRVAISGSYPSGTANDYAVYEINNRTARRGLGVKKAAVPRRHGEARARCKKGAIRSLRCKTGKATIKQAQVRAHATARTPSTPRAGPLSGGDPWTTASSWVSRRVIKPRAPWREKRAGSIDTMPSGKHLALDRGPARARRRRIDECPPTFFFFRDPEVSVGSGRYDAPTCSDASCRRQFTRAPVPIEGGELMGARDAMRCASIMCV
ncbi:hypothetical protein FB451DRAFT_1174140 [Mycena latifolia]|nr:hypothetical protein FB451DRAFT_1174140 [Mycena latifolia]